MKAFWGWVKTYWEWLLAGLLLTVGFLLGVSLRKRPVVVQGSNPEKKQAEEEAHAQARKAEQQAADKRAEAQKEHDDDLAVVVDKIQEKTEEVRADSKKVNEYLHSVGKDIRGEEP